MNNELNLVWATDENYVFLAGVSMTSALESNMEFEKIRIWILADRLRQESKELLSKCAGRYGREIHFIDVEKELLEIQKTGAISWGEGHSYSAYSRLFLEKLLSKYDVERAIYCDCDLIIDGSLKEIHNWELRKEGSSGKAIGLVMDYNRVEIRDLLGLKRTAPYYNTGFMLLDLQLWREHKCTERIIQHMKSEGARYPFIDQDLTNCVLANEIDTLPIQYNVNPRVMMFTYKQLCIAYGMNDKNYYSQKEYNNVHFSKPIVYHCSDPAAGRPWERGNHHIYGYVWNKYFSISMWKNVYIPKEYVPNKSSILQQKLMKFLPMGIYAYILGGASKRAMKKTIKRFERK